MFDDVVGAILGLAGLVYLAVGILHFVAELRGVRWPRR
jgi:hypothetical protein